MQVEEGSEEGRTVAGLAEGRLQESGVGCRRAGSRWVGGPGGERGAQRAVRQAGDRSCGRDLLGASLCRREQSLAEGGVGAGP